ncbi:hypothetical protein [Noviherbaspirillum pedocola]|uniref:Uncharacterized protein n=1 Tax=Noviherbaspirillum pedocola TaxID=2801341 RepID=A0A934W7X5_9BURK|nr:hypothetical protein [Noviherbaspirillum pedocola]MBK4736138.1 hypothetical protein [Noviherbaspirillum pedocola]
MSSSANPVDSLEPSLIQNREDLLAAGVPAEFDRGIVQGIAAFWQRFSDLYPEVTSGDSQMADEPGNAIALWLCESAGIPIDDSCLALQDQGLAHDTPDEVRFEAVVRQCIEAARDGLRPLYAQLAEPSERVRTQLANVAADVLHWNFPRDDQDRENDE